MGRRPAAGARGVLRDGRHVLPGVDAGQPLPRAGSAWGGPPTGPATTPPLRRARRVGVACCAASAETGDCFCELPTAPRDGRGGARRAGGGAGGGRSVATDGRRPTPARRGAGPTRRPSRELRDGELPAPRLKAFIGASTGLGTGAPALLDWFRLARAVRRSARGRRELPFAHEARDTPCVHARADAPGVASLPEPGQPRQHRGEVRLYVNGGLTAGSHLNAS